MEINFTTKKIKSIDSMKRYILSCYKKNIDIYIDLREATPINQPIKKGTKFIQNVVNLLADVDVQKYGLKFSLFLPAVFSSIDFSPLMDKHFYHLDLSYCIAPDLEIFKNVFSLKLTGCYNSDVFDCSFDTRHLVNTQYLDISNCKSIQPKHISQLPSTITNLTISAYNEKINYLFNIKDKKKSPININNKTIYSLGLIKYLPSSVKTINIFSRIDDNYFQKIINNKNKNIFKFNNRTFEYSELLYSNIRHTIKLRFLKDKNSMKDY